MAHPCDGLNWREQDKVFHHVLRQKKIEAADLYKRYMPETKFGRAFARARHGKATLRDDYYITLAHILFYGKE